MSRVRCAERESGALLRCQRAEAEAQEHVALYDRLRLHTAQLDSTIAASRKVEEEVLAAAHRSLDDNAEQGLSILIVISLSLSRCQCCAAVLQKESALQELAQVNAGLQSTIQQLTEVAKESQARFERELLSKDRIPQQPSLPSRGEEEAATV